MLIKNPLDFVFFTNIAKRGVIYGSALLEIEISEYFRWTWNLPLWFGFSTQNMKDFEMSIASWLLCLTQKDLFLVLYIELTPQVTKSECPAYVEIFIQVLV